MTVFRAATLRTFFFAFHAGAKELKPDLMYYDVTVIENPAYEGIMRLPLKIIYFVASYWQMTRCTLPWCNTNGIVVCKKLWLKRLQ